MTDFNVSFRIEESKVNNQIIGLLTQLGWKLIEIEKANDKETESDHR